MKTIEITVHVPYEEYMPYYEIRDYAEKQFISIKEEQYQLFREHWYNVVANFHKLVEFAIYDSFHH